MYLVKYLYLLGSPLTWPFTNNFLHANLIDSFVICLHLLATISLLWWVFLWWWYPCCRNEFSDVFDLMFNFSLQNCPWSLLGICWHFNFWTVATICFLNSSWIHGVQCLQCVSMGAAFFCFCTIPSNLLHGTCFFCAQRFTTKAQRTAIDISSRQVPNLFPSIMMI